MAGPDSEYEAITVASFGANVVFLYQGIGDSEDWHVVDEIVEQTNISLLRYPGGSVTERYFDLSAPNRDFLDSNHNGMFDPGERSVLPQDEFLAYCGAAGIDASLVVQMSSAPILVSNASGENAYTVDADWLADLRNYIRTSLSDADQSGATVKSFELGNEYYAEDFDVSYEPGSTTLSRAAAYGVIANEALVAIQDEIDSFRAEKGYGADWLDPEIAIQAVAPNSHLLNRDAELWVAGVVQRQLDPDAVAALDALIGHYYFFDGQEFSDIRNDIAFADELFESWDTFIGRDLERHITEWNVDGGNLSFTGRAQLIAVMEAFYQFHTIDVDSMVFWPSEHHPTALGVWDGDDAATLNPVGELMSFMQDHLTGFWPIDTAEPKPGLFLQAYERSDVVKVFLGSTQEYEQNIQLSDYLGEGPYLDALKISTNCSHNVSNGSLVLDALPIDNAEETFRLDPFETIYVEVSRTFIGTADNDLLRAGYFTQKMMGKNGHDHLIGSIRAETIEGGEGDDFILGRNGEDFLRGGSGADTLKGGGSADRLVGNTGNDVVRGGAGDDVMRGNLGEDHLLGARGADILRGGAHNDQIQGGRGADKLFGNSGDDILDGGGGGDVLVGGHGDDVFVFERGLTGPRDVIRDFGAGHDVVQVAENAQVSAHHHARGTEIIINGHHVLLVGYDVDDWGRDDLLFG